MKETGIIMSGDHPRLILNGLKTMTRRTWGLGKINKDPDAWMLVAVFQDGLARFGKRDGSQELTVKCPSGGYGDRLWVRETWAEQGGDIYYKSDWGNTKPVNMVYNNIRWRSPFFMPRWVSRILLEITELRAERLQEITEEDAIAEGCPSREETGFDTARYRFHILWDSLNAKRYPWALNPWVWVFAFNWLQIVW
jgi:hypothetical protein